MITKKQWLTAFLMFIAFLVIRHYFFKETVVTEESIRNAYANFTPAEKAAVEAHIEWALTTNEGLKQ